MENINKILKNTLLRHRSKMNMSMETYQIFMSSFSIIYAMIYYQKIRRKIVKP